MKTLPLILTALLSSSVSAGTLYESGSPTTAADTQTQNTSRIAPAGCPPDQPIDSCAPTVKPFDCPSGRHWTNQGGNGLAHCVDDDYICPVDYSLTHDALGNPSCSYAPLNTQNDTGGVTGKTNEFKENHLNTVKFWYTVAALDAGDGGWHHWTGVATSCLSGGPLIIGGNPCQVNDDPSFVPGFYTNPHLEQIQNSGFIFGYVDENGYYIGTGWAPYLTMPTNLSVYFRVRGGGGMASWLSTSFLTANNSYNELLEANKNNFLFILTPQLLTDLKGAYP